MMLTMIQRLLLSTHNDYFSVLTMIVAHCSQWSNDHCSVLTFFMLSRERGSVIQMDVRTAQRSSFSRWSQWRHTRHNAVAARQRSRTVSHNHLVSLVAPAWHTIRIKLHQKQLLSQSQSTHVFHRALICAKHGIQATLMHADFLCRRSPNPLMCVVICVYIYPV